MKKFTETIVKKVVSLTLVFTLLFTSIPITSNADTTDITVEEIEQIMEDAETETEDLIDVFDENLEISEDGLYEIDENKINQLVEDMNLDDIIKIYELHGLEITNQDLVDTLLTNIESLNEQIEDGELILLENGSLIDSDDDEFYLQGGVTKDVKKWWGIRMYKSTSSANAWIRTLQKGANTNNLAAVIAGAATAGVWGIGGIPNAIAGYYLGNMAADASYYNSKCKRGIIADIRFVISYKIKNQ